VPEDARRVRSILRPLAARTDISVSETTINGNRMDFVLTGSDDALWSVVLRCAHNGSVENVAVFERPAPFSGTPGGFVVCVGGASSSGKSTLMEALCERATTPWTRFDEQCLGVTPMRFLIWPERSGPMRDGFFAAVREYARAGNQVILPLSAGIARERFGEMPHLFVRLDCPLDVLLARQSRRADRWAGLAEETFEQIQASDDRYDLHIDTASTDAERAAEIVLGEVAQVRAAIAREA
jgi:chloramphenicol 3-O-phosphotransferase